MFVKALFMHLTAVTAVLTLTFTASAQVAVNAPTLVTQGINSEKLITLAGTMRPEATAKADRGAVADSLPMEHLWLQLKRSSQQQQALNQYMQELQDPGSPNFHKWLTAAQFGATYGLAQTDVTAITEWLQSQGLTVNGVLPNRMLIDFSGTAGTVGRAFHTAIHNFSVNGSLHVANASNQQIPAALASSVAGVVSLSDIHPHALHTPVRLASATPSATFGDDLFLGAGDFETIYNLNPLFSAGYSGAGQTIVVLEDSDVYDPSEWSQFRRLFGLTRPYVQGTFTQIHPALPGSPCIDPGATGDDDEATLDAQWASAAAPNASIVLASCDNTYNFGVFSAFTNLLNGPTAPPAIMSISYGGSEAEQGSSNPYIYFTYQQAAAEGVSLFVSSGDSGGDNNSTDRTNGVDTFGISVNGLASTEYNTAVGGTDFEDTYFGTNSTYWSATNSATFESAKSYIPEIPWNDSCASQLIATASGYATTYGATGFCNSAAAATGGFINNAAGSGGPSAIYPKPSWQQGVFGNPNDQVRDLPDVSLFASNGVWNHAYMFCYSQPSQGTAYPCSQGYFYLAGGTSFASPIMAAIQALANEKTGSRWGVTAPYYYALANSEYGSSGNSACDSSNGPDSTCIFHDITQGDMDTVCATLTPNCYSTSYTDTYGVLSVSPFTFEPAYAAGSGWDFATGLGSVNAYNFVMKFPGATPTVSARLH